MKIKVKLLISACLLISIFCANQLQADNITYKYDELNRIIEVVYSDGTTITYTYDKVGNRLIKDVSFPAETVSAPSAPSGPTSGIQGTSYSFSVGGSSSNLRHPLQYFVDWGDGTDSGWLLVGTTAAFKSWASPGTYSLKGQARCSTHPSVMSSWSGTLLVNIEPLSITLESPPNGTVFSPCTLIPNDQPSFNWTPSGAYARYSIFVSKSPTDFASQGILIYKTTLPDTSNVWIPSITQWRAIMAASHNRGNIRDVYWKVVGTMVNNTGIETEVRSFRIRAPEAVKINAPNNGAILSSSTPPTFNFESNCNIRFRLELSSLADFSSPTKLRRFFFTTKDPNVETTSTYTLTRLQWNAVKRLVGGGGYFRFIAWDRIHRKTISQIRSFTVE